MPTDPKFEDVRGPNIRELRCIQRRLSSVEVEALIADYEGGRRSRGAGTKLQSTSVDHDDVTIKHRLIVLRGPSGSGKSSTAQALRARMGRGTAWIEQDYIRRIVLREHDQPDAANIDLIAINVRFALERNFNVVLEGILPSDHYSGMLEELHRDYSTASVWHYFDVPFEETVRRHATRPQAAQFSAEDMRGWYRPADLLGFIDETIIGEDSPIEDTVNRIYHDAISLFSET